MPITEARAKRPAEATEVGPPPSVALSRKRQQSTEVVQWTPRFVMSVDQAVEMVNEKRRFMDEVLKEGVHYGRIPGAPKDAKPALLKPGAETLNAAMGLHPELSDAEAPVRDFTGSEHGGQPYWSFRRICRIYRQTGPAEHDRMLIAQAEGSCSSWEVKYRYRDQRRKCPQCGQETINQSRPPKDNPQKTQLGFYCWKKVGGCGAQFSWNDAHITKQVVGRGPNPDVFDLENTGLKMADKRALVATTLLATGVSDLFTQDVEDAALDPDGRMPTVEGEYVEPEATEVVPLEDTSSESKDQGRHDGVEQNDGRPGPAIVLTPQQRQLLVHLGNTLDVKWPAERYADELLKEGGFLPVRDKLLGLHREQHGNPDQHWGEAIMAAGSAG